VAEIQRDVKVNLRLKLTIKLYDSKNEEKD